MRKLQRFVSESLIFNANQSQISSRSLANHYWISNGKAWKSERRFYHFLRVHSPTDILIVLGHTTDPLSCKEKVTTGYHSSSRESRHANIIRQCRRGHSRQVASVHTVGEQGCCWTCQISCFQESADICCCPCFHFPQRRMLRWCSHTDAHTWSSHPRRRCQLQLHYVARIRQPWVVRKQLQIERCCVHRRNHCLAAEGEGVRMLHGC